MADQDLPDLGLQKRFHKKPGTAAGIDAEQVVDKLAAAPGAAPVRLTCIDYGPDDVSTAVVEDLDAFLAQHRPEWSRVRWINVDGLSDARVLAGLAKKYDLHPLAVEDVLHVPQRAKVDYYGEPGGDRQARLFVIAQMIERRGERLEQDQVSFFLGHRTLLTFQERPGDVWDPVRQRLQSKGSRLRVNDASFLLYSLIDAIVDQCFPILEAYGDGLEDLERRVLSRPGRHLIVHVHKIRRELMLLRRMIWPMREVVNTIAREPHECLSDTTRTYLRDVYDHITQLIDIVETYREIGTGITETHMAAIGNRLNEIMKVLTMISVVFIPITFLASVFGMNFEHFPWKWRYGFEAFAAACLLVTAGMLAWFRRRRWL